LYVKAYGCNDCNKICENVLANLTKITTRVVAATAAAALALAGVAAATTPATAASKLKIAFVMGAESDPFFQAMKVGAQAEAAAQGVDLIWQGDASHYDVATEVPIVENVIAQKPDGLVLIPTDPTGLQAANDKAIAAGIAVANVDTHVGDLSKVITFITGDNGDGGAKAADAIAAKIGYKKGGSYQVVVGLTSATATTNVGRLDGFKKQVAAKYPGIKIVDVAYSASNPQTANSNVKNWLSKFPKLNGIFAIDGTNASGAAAALQAKHLTGKIALVGYDAYPANVALIKAGVFTALIAQDPAAEARLAIKTLVAYINNKTKPAKRDVVIPNVALTAKSSAADLKKYTYVATK
jgi:ABC-type sugar transport system substrate-binding protein